MAGTPDPAGTKPRIWPWLYLPGVVTGLGVIIVATILGGWVATFLAALLAVPAMGLAAVLCLVIQLSFPSLGRGPSLLAGVVAFALAAGVIMWLFNEFGPSQIM